MAAVIGLVVGMIVGGIATGSGVGAFVTGLIGAFVGWIVWGRRSKGAAPSPASDAGAAAQPSAPPQVQETLAYRVQVLERRVADLERALRNAAAPAQSADTTDYARTVIDEAIAARAPVVLPEPPPAPALNADGTQALPPAIAPEEAEAQPITLEPATLGPPRPPAPPQPPNPVWAWIVGGNTLARLGVVLLFIGVGFLLKYAVEHVQVPISVRLALVAIGAVVLLVIGWRLRTSRRAYAMALQGGGVGILYLTIFAALRLYALVPPLAAFGLLVWICAISSWLAIRQDALSLAVLAVAGGFLAPILTSSQSGNHVLLFSYYALLNAGILGIAWFKAWRVLNLLGFAFTFIVGTAWGVTRYRPENFATTEPFLIAFFLFYVAIAVLYALRRSVELRDYVDAGLVFGTPLVAAGLQAALVRDIEYAMSVSALAMSALYLVLARFLYTRRRDDLRLLVESFLALGVVFATLAIPLAVDPHWTAAAWAVEGAAIVWAGVRQQRLAVRAFGYLLEFGAGTAFFFGPAPWLPVPPGVYPIVNSGFVGGVLVALAGLFSAWFVDRNRDRVHGAERAIAIAFFVWGTVWWLFAGGHEIDRFVAANYALASVLVFLAASAIAFAVLEKRLSWPMARVPAMLLLPALLVIAIGASADTWTTSEALFAYGGFVAWPVAVGAAIALLWWYDDKEVFKNMHAPLSLELWHAGLFWLVLLIVTHEVAWAGTRIAQGRGVWSAVPWGLVPALAIVAIGALASRAGWPIGAHRRGYLVIGATPIAVILVVWSIAASILGAGDPWPLPYVPILNPLDLTQAIVLLALASWAIRAGREEPALFAALPKHAMVALLCALAFLWINAIALRTIHFWYGVPYDPAALWRSTLVQAVLSLLWSSIALATMAVANRKQWRVAWFVGAVLLGAVVAKLFFVELAQVGTITRIVSFIGVGLLLLLIGYLAPIPPRRKESAS